jgi:Family of unknown function (DUF5681)
MTDSPDEYRVGYGKPPKHTRWRKGQSGNPRQKRLPSNRPETMADIIDRLLNEPLRVVLQGAPSKMSALEAIVQNLSQKALSGNGKALRVLLEYREYFQRRQPAKRSKVVFLDTDATRALSDAQPEADDV